MRRIEAGYKPFRSTQLKFARDLGETVDALWPLSLDRNKKPVPA